jgi:hypothetical protein
MRTFYKIGLWLLALSLPLATMAQSVPTVRTIETPNATLQLNAESGDLVGLNWKNPALQIISEPRL